MFDIGFGELVVIFLVALFVLGPEKLPEVARTLGKMVGHLKRSMGDLKAEIDREVNVTKYAVTEHQVPNLKGEPVTLKTVAEKEEPAAGPESETRPPVDGEPAPVERSNSGEPVSKGAVAPAPAPRPQTSAWPTETSVQPLAEGSEPHSNQQPEAHTGQQDTESGQDKPESEKHDTEGRA